MAWPATTILAGINVAWIEEALLLDFFQAIRLLANIRQRIYRYVAMAQEPDGLLLARCAGRISTLRFGMKLVLAQHVAIALDTRAEANGAAGKGWSMRALYSIVVVVLSATLGACAQNGVQSGPVPTRPSVVSQPRAGWLSVAARAKNTPLLYVSAAFESVVDIYPEYGKNVAPIGQITDGIDEPEGMAVDRHGNLYVTNPGNGAGSGTIREAVPARAKRILPACKLRSTSP